MFGSCLQVGQVGADSLLDAVESVGVSRVFIDQPRVRDASGIQEPDVLNQVRVSAGKLLVILVVHHENIIRPRQVVGGDLGGDVSGKIVAAFCGDAGHRRVSVPADVPVLRAPRADLEVNPSVICSQGAKHGLSGR
jgi:hypothetical protein